MFGIFATNPDESLCASIAWNLWTEGRLATDLLAGALPGIEHSVYWTPPFYYIVLAGWQGMWGPGLLSVRCLSLVLGLAVLVILWQRRRHAGPAAWTASAIVIFDPMFQRAASMGRMDMLAIALTVAAIAVIEHGRSRRHCLGAGILSAAALLTHPLGAAAVVAVGLTCLRGRLPAMLPFLLGCAPLLLAWMVYLSLDPETFVAQMGLQLAVKADHARSPVDNVVRLVEFYGSSAAVFVGGFIGGMTGLLRGRRQLEPWLIGITSLCPVIIFSGELIYPAYLAPFTAVGLCHLLADFHWGRRALAAAVAVLAIRTAVDPPPLAGIDPHYQSYCDYVSAHLGSGHSVIVAVVPDPWFGLQGRADLRFRLAPPVLIPEDRLRAYVAQADDIVMGGYNPPGFYPILKDWEELAAPGQHLWWLDRGLLLGYEDIRDRLQFR